MPRPFSRNITRSDEQTVNPVTNRASTVFEPGRYLLISRMPDAARKVSFLRVRLRDGPQPRNTETMELAGRRCFVWACADFRVHRHALLRDVAIMGGKGRFEPIDHRIFHVPGICWWLFQSLTALPLMLSRPVGAIGELVKSLLTGGAAGMFRFVQRHIKIRRDRFMRNVAYPEWVILKQDENSTEMRGSIADPAGESSRQKFVHNARCDVADILSSLRALPDREKPFVSILIPTRDRLDMLRACVDSVLKKTTWPSCEIIVIDNGSREQATLDWLKHEQGEGAIRVLRDEQSFNYSALNNAGAKVAKGKYLCLLNNDVEVITPEWLEEMVAVGELPEVGAVGAKLLYPEGVLQHAGMVLNSGALASHAWRNFPGDHSGPPAQLRQVSAVTGACLLTPKAVFEEVGGLDEDNLAVSLNDVDYCLKIAEAGKRVLYTPFACLYHRESLSRGADRKGAKLARALAEQQFMRRRWPNAFSKDQFAMPDAPGWMAEEGWLS